MVVALVATNSFVGKPTAVRLDTQRHWADRRMLQWGSPSPPPAPPRPPPAAVGGGAFCAAASQACGQGSQLGQICRQRWGGAVVAHYMPGAPGATEGPSLECLRSYIAVATRNSPSEATARSATRHGEPTAAARTRRASFAGSRYGAPRPVSSTPAVEAGSRRSQRCGRLTLTSCLRLGRAKARTARRSLTRYQLLARWG